ncbi:MAG TPA: MFS transporter [Burkholderiales bacterium]|nr:MFS transporter [Burkholderiales bacterium]
MNPANRVTWSLWALCIGNFVIGTGTLIVPGMLPTLAEGLDVSLPMAAQLVTAFAASVCVGAPILATATSRFDRRTLLAATLGLYFAGHLAAALVSSYAAVLVARILSSAGAALFTAQAAAVAALLVPAEQRGRAIAFVFLGWSVASVAGVPLGAYVGATWGWRAGFALVALGSAIAAGAVWLLIPSGLRVKAADAAMWRAILGNRALLALLGVTGLFMGATFALFCYFVPASQAFVGASPALVSALLALFGAAAVAGNAIAARYMDRFGAGNVVLLCLALMAAGHLLWPLTQGSTALLAAAVLIWGLGGFAANSAQQTRLVAIAPSQASVSIALNTSAVFLGQAAGAAGASALVVHIPGSDGFAAIPWISVPLLCVAVGLSLYASLRMRAHPRSAHVQGRPA